MFLFKSSGATYDRVVANSVHAFNGSPAAVKGDEFVLLSKNRVDCEGGEEQVQYVAKLARVRLAGPEEIDQLFPGVGASS